MMDRVRSFLNLERGEELPAFLLFSYLTLVLCLIALAFLPLSQRTLVYSGYGPRGGRSSAAGTASSLEARRV